MITHEEAKGILNKKEKKYSDEEVKTILEILKRIAQIEITFLKTKK